MKVTPRKSKQIVNKFVAGKESIPGNTLNDVAKTLRRDYRGGSVQLMTCLLQKKMRAQRLFEYKVEGQTFYGSFEQMRRDLGIPKGTSRAAVINTVKGGASIQMQVAA